MLDKKLLCKVEVFFYFKQAKTFDSVRTWGNLGEQLDKFPKNAQPFTCKNQFQKCLDRKQRQFVFTSVSAYVHKTKG